MNIKLSSGEIRNYRYIYLGQAVCTRHCQCVEVWVRYCLSLDLAQEFVMQAMYHYLMCSDSTVYVHVYE